MNPKNNVPLASRLAALRQMTPAELKQQYQQLFGEPARTGNKDFLAKRCAWRIQSLAEGGLSERAWQRAAELARDADLRTTIPRQMLTSTRGGGTVVTAPLRSSGTVAIPGTVLTRQYKGRLIQVTVLPSGFEHQGQRYRSLSAIAKAVTGTQWNGHLFFGLRS